jgi:hypothetical protein
MPERRQLMKLFFFFLFVICLSANAYAKESCPNDYAHVSGIYRLFDNYCYVKGDLYCPRNITFRYGRTCPPDLPFTCATLLSRGKSGVCTVSKQEAMRLGCDELSVVTCKSGMLKGS